MLPVCSCVVSFFLLLLFFSDLSLMCVCFILSYTFMQAIDFKLMVSFCVSRLNGSCAKSRVCVCVCGTDGYPLTFLPFKTRLLHHTASYAVSWVHSGSRKWEWGGGWGGGGGGGGGRVTDLWAGSSDPGCTYFACWGPIKRCRSPHPLPYGKACDTWWFLNWWFVSVWLWVLVGGHKLVSVLDVLIRVPLLGLLC